MYDALKVFSSSLRDFSADADIEVEELNCLSPSKWSQGEKILKILDEVILSNAFRLCKQSENEYKNIPILCILEI